MLTNGDKWTVGRQRDFKLPWREAGPPNHHDDKVDSDQPIVNKELSLSDEWTVGWQGPDVFFQAAEAANLVHALVPAVHVTADSADKC